MTMAQPTASIVRPGNRRQTRSAATMAIFTSYPPSKKAGATRVVKTATGTAFNPASMRGGMDFIRVIRT
ncbi:hypothetical protein D3C71_2088360 [compost metagenome]